MAQWETFKTSASKLKEKSLKGRVCVVGGGSGTVGSGIIRSLLQEGATVIAPLRRHEQIDQLRDDCAGLSEAQLDCLVPVVVTISHEGYCREFVGGILQRYGRIDHAISCFGGYTESGLLTDQSVEEFYRVMGDNAVTHFIFAKYVLPAMKNEPGASFLFVTGGAGERCVTPESSLYTVASATLYGIIAAAQAQYAGHAFRINELRLSTFFRRHSELKNQSFQDYFGKRSYSNRKVGKLAADVLASSGHTERVVATNERLDGISLTV